MTLLDSLWTNRGNFYDNMQLSCGAAKGFYYFHFPLRNLFTRFNGHTLCSNPLMLCRPLTVWLTSSLTIRLISDECRMYRTERQSHNLQSALTEYLIESMYICQVWWMRRPRCRHVWARAARPPLHRGDLEEGRPHEIISSKTEKIRVQRHEIWQTYWYKEIVKQRRAITKRGPGCDAPDPSIREEKEP